MAKGSSPRRGAHRIRDIEVISYTMSRIRSTDTSIELALRRALWKDGLRFRKNYRAVTGAPDVAFTRAKVAVFCDSSFWHGRDWGRRKRRILSNRPYWWAKIGGNIARDKRVNATLTREGWLVVRFWDIEIEQNVEHCVEQVRAALIGAAPRAR
jgi:DNA mismatch endonuclease (patch repair protein)